MSCKSFEIPQYFAHKIVSLLYLYTRKSIYKLIDHIEGCRIDIRPMLICLFKANNFHKPTFLMECYVNSDQFKHLFTYINKSWHNFIPHRPQVRNNIPHI